MLLAFLIYGASSVYSQNIAQTEVFADSLFATGDYKSALNEYRRAYYFAVGDSAKILLAQKVADTYMLNEHYDFAKSFCDSICYYTISDSVRNEAYLKKITCLILEKQYGDALVGLDKMNVGNFPTQTKRKLFLNGVACLGLTDFDNSYQYFSKLIDPNDSALLANVQQQFVELKKSYRHQPYIPACFSAIVPGLGQMFSGHYSEGFNSFFLLAALSSIGYFLQPLNVLLFPMIARYYMGGILHAYHYADERRNFNKTENSVRILSLLNTNEPFMTKPDGKNDRNEFNKYTIDSEREISLLISTAFLFYKKFLSSQDVDACIFTPSCSVYMMEAIKKEGMFVGFLDGTDRLLRCHGFADHTHYNTNLKTGKLQDEP